MRKQMGADFEAFNVVVLRYSTMQQMAKSFLIKLQRLPKYTIIIGFNSSSTYQRKNNNDFVLGYDLPMIFRFAGLSDELENFEIGNHVPLKSGHCDEESGEWKDRVVWHQLSRHAEFRTCLFVDIMPIIYKMSKIVKSDEMQLHKSKKFDDFLAVWGLQGKNEV